MPQQIRVFDVEVQRVLDTQSLHVVSEAEAEAAEDEGFLGGNQYYQDLRGWTWSEVRAVLDAEARAIARIALSADPAAAEARFEDERDADEDPIEALFGLDVGVAAAVLALSALGAMPYISCNAGSFGGPHQGARPY